MAKVINPHFKKINKNKTLMIYSKRTIKKSGGDDFNYNIRGKGLSPKKK